MIGTHDDLLEYRTHYRWAVILIAVAFTVLAARLFHLQVLQGERYEALATISHVVKERIVPPRGTIRDRNGTVLATDVEVADLTMVPHYVKDPEGETARMVALGVLAPDDAARIIDQIAQAKKGKKRFHRLTAHRNLVGNRCPDDLSALSFDQQAGRMVCPRCGQSFVDQRAVIQTHLHELPGFALHTRMVRHYPMRDLAMHAIGYVNEVNAEEVAADRQKYRPGDVIGRAGIERALDDALRGVPGQDVYVRMAGGNRLRPEELPEPFQGLTSFPPRQGADVTLTLDLGMQQAAVSALSRQRSGAVVAMDAQTGEVLALASHPTFAIGPRLRSQSAEPAPPTDPVYAPMVDKAVSAYPPGSTFKMITALAGLAEGAIAEPTEVDCPGHYEYKGRKFNCFKRSGHGPLTLVPAIAQSCDTYFYLLGDLLGIDTLARYARDGFGLGEATGIEIREQEGVVPTEAWYRAKGRRFQPGFAINAAVGQGDVKVTPLAMARAYAALVNGGRLLRPTLVRHVGPPETAPREVAPQVVREVDLAPEFVDLVMRGMWGAVNDPDGTAAASAIPDLPFAGKTGTAQAPERRPGVDEDVARWLLEDHAWFVGYAPARRPRVVVAAFVEHGGFGGAVATPIVRKVIEAYYAEHAEEFADLWEGFDDDEPLEVIEAP
jgi:penicillin-binding protein 2